MPFYIKECFLLGALAADAATLGCGCLGLVLFDTCKLGVNHNATAVLTYDNFFAHTNIHLTLRGYLAETTCTSITLYIYDTKTVA